MADDLWNIDAGDLRFRVEIQENTPTTNSKGESVESWATVATRWASIAPASGQRFTASEQVRNTISHKIVMRYYDGLTAKHRIKRGSRIFNIATAPLDEGDLHVRHTILATEVVA